MEIVVSVVSIGILAFWIWMIVLVLGKAGRSGWWCLLMFVPLVNIVMVWLFAFARWPAVEAPAASAAAASPAEPQAGPAPLSETGDPGEPAGTQD